MWWGKEATALERVRDVAGNDPLVTSFGGGLVIVAMAVQPTGYELTWTIRVAGGRTLPEVERFIAKVATYIIDEPL